MDIRLHKNARTTPAIRSAIQQSCLSISELARQFNLTPNTVRKWKKRPEGEVQDASSKPKRMNTALAAWQEDIVVEIRKDLMLPLDDLLVCVRKFIEPTMTRSSLLRLLKRHGVNNLNFMIKEQKQCEGIPDKKPYKTFKDYEPGYLHVDVKYLPQMPDEKSRSYLFVARDRATRWVHIAIKPDKSAKSAKQFLQELTEKFPAKIHTILTDNGKEFTDRFTAEGERKPTGNHLFDQKCNEHGIEHRLTKPFSPQTNGMVERFNGMIQQIINTTKFNSVKELQNTIINYCYNYNHNVHLRCLDHQTPAKVIKKLTGNNLPSPDTVPASMDCNCCGSPTITNFAPACWQSDMILYICLLDTIPASSRMRTSFLLSVLLFIYATCFAERVLPLLSAIIFSAISMRASKLCKVLAFMPISRKPLAAMPEGAIPRTL